MLNSLLSRGKKSSKKNKSKKEDHLADPLTAKATVMGSAMDSEYAFDDSFTPALVKSMKDDPKLSLDDALSGMTTGSLGTGQENDSGLHHPTIVSYGQERAAEGKRKPRKRAVLMANQRYKHISGLNTPVAESKTFASVLKSRGYKTKRRSNRTAKSMESGWNGMISSAKKGDQLVAYFAGHGAEDGLVGIKYGGPKKNNDMVSYSTVSSMVSQATGKGANIRFIMDSCHSGSGTQLVRQQQIGQLAEKGSGVTAKVVSLALSLMQEERGKLLGHVHAREAGITEADGKIRKHQGATPDDDASDELWDQWFDTEEKLGKAREKLEKRFDKKAHAMWKQMRSGMAFVAQFSALDAPPEAITDLRTLGAQLKSIDSLSNHLLKWGQDAEAEDAELRK